MEKAESIEDPPEEEDVSKNPPEEEDVSKSECESHSFVEVACAQLVINEVKPDVLAKFEAYASGFKTKADALAALLACGTSNIEARGNEPKDDDAPVKRADIAYDEDVWALLAPAA